MSALAENEQMATTGTNSTRLVILRGDSGSGKTTTALALRSLLGPQVALLQQDYFRREVLSGADKIRRGRDTSLLMVVAARLALDLGYDVILDGIFNLRDYAKPFEALHDDHLGVTRVYQFDVGLVETIRRHSTRPLGDVFGEDKLREWYDGWQPLPRISEHRVTADITTEELVARILRDLGES